MQLHLTGANRPEIRTILISALKAYEASPRTHSRNQRKKLENLLRLFGQITPIIVDQNMTIIDGHAVWEAMRELGHDEVSIVVVSGRSDPDIRALRLALNRLPHDAGWESEKLRNELQYLVDASYDLDVTAFGAVEIDHLLEIDHGGDLIEDGDEIPSPSGPQVSQKGDIWISGSHRIGCGDALDASFVQKLLSGVRPTMSFIDPPYNVRIGGFASGNGETKHREFVQASGDMSEAEFILFLTKALSTLKSVLSPGALIYSCMDWRHLFELLTAGRDAELELLNICVWAKTTPGLGSFYRSQHELVCVLKSGEGPYRNNIEHASHGRNRSNLWTYRGLNSFGDARNELVKQHPTVKPVALIADAIRDVTKRADTVIDTFLGSGSTLMAAEETGRFCYGVELDPLYVDVAIRRWQEATKRDAVLLETGETFEERAEHLAKQPVEA